MVVLRQHRALRIAIGVLMFVACTSAFAGRSRTPAAGVYGISDEQLLAPDASANLSASKSKRAAKREAKKAAKRAAKKRRQKDTTVALSDVSAMTYDARSQRFYAIGDASSSPQLLTIDPATGQATAIGPIILPGLDLTLVEALAVDPEKGTLFAAGGDSTFASNILMTIDPKNAQARPVAEVRGTIQNEIDAMTFADDQLYVIDGAAKSSTLYRIDSGTARAEALGGPFPGNVTDLAYDAANGRLVGAQNSGGPLLAISFDGKVVGEFPVASGELRAVAVIPGASAAAEGR